MNDNELYVHGEEWCAGDFYKETSFECTLTFDKFFIENVNQCEGGYKAFRTDLENLFKTYFPESSVQSWTRQEIESERKACEEE